MLCVFGLSIIHFNGFAGQKLNRHGARPSGADEHARAISLAPNVPYKLYFPRRFLSPLRSNAALSPSFTKPFFNGDGMELRPMNKSLTIIDILAASPLFHGLPLEQLAAVKAIAVAKTYDRGESIFAEGDSGAGFYLVADGKVKVFKLSPAGKEYILHIFGPGEPFGEVGVFHGQPFPANAETLAPSRLLYFPRADFARLLADSAIAMNLLAVMALRLRRFASQIENLSLKEVPSRLASYLLYLSEEQDDRSQVILDISKGQLASLLGTSPETLSRIFAKMTEEGLIEVRGRVIVLNDVPGLNARR